MTERRPTGLHVVTAAPLACAAALLMLCSVHAQEPAATYADLLRTYRSGAFESGVKALDAVLTEKDGQRQTHQWIEYSVRLKRQGDLEAALLICTEAIMVAWAQDDVYPERSLRTRGDPLRRLHQALKTMDRRSPFLRAWYLLWESFRQTQVYLPLPELDYLDEALDAFPNDAQVLLAAGSRQELNWLMSFSNSQRDPLGEPPAVTRFLVDARGFLRRSLAADDTESEARLRLVRVLLALNELGEAAETFAGYNWPAAGRGFEYLARLFEGDLHERRGDRAAAAKAYDRAIALVAVPQAARIARAHLAHSEGLRAEAAASVMRALSEPPTESDPWWWYIRGQAWLFDGYLKAARAMVRQ